MSGARGGNKSHRLAGIGCHEITPDSEIAHPLFLQDEMIRGYQDLKVWQRSMALVEDSYRLTGTFPKHELYGLTSQVRRAAVSVAANIAEGHGREHLGDYLHSLSIANGSLMELETHIQIGGRMKYLSAEAVKAFLQKTGEVGRMLAGLTRALKRRAA